MIAVHFHPDRYFFMIQAMKKGWSDFSVVGVFSKEQDAAAVKKELEESGLYLVVCQPQEVEMPVILDVLCKEKLGPIFNLIANNQALKKP